MTSSPSSATSAAYAIWARSRSASFWFTGLSSARRMRSGCRSPSAAVASRPRCGRRSSRRLGAEENRGDRVVQRRRLDRLREPGGQRAPRRGRACRSTRGSRPASRPPRRAPGRRSASASSRPSSSGISRSKSAMSKRAPSATQRSASADEPVSRGTIPHRVVCATRMRRFVALSSTTSTVRPVRSAVDPHRPGRRRPHLPAAAVSATAKPEDAALPRHARALRVSDAVP